METNKESKHTEPATINMLLIYGIQVIMHLNFPFFIFFYNMLNFCKEKTH